MNTGGSGDVYILGFSARSWREFGLNFLLQLLLLVGQGTLTPCLSVLVWHLGPVTSRG
jgi:hypothetical protein